VGTPLLNFLILLVATPILLAVMLAFVMRIFTISGRGLSSQVVVIICAMLGNVPMGTAAWFLYLQKVTTAHEFVTGIIYFLLTYNALAYSFFHIFNMSETARRIKILNEINTTGGKMKISGLSISYSSGEMLTNRLTRLLDSRQVVRTGDRYALNSRLLYFAAKVVNLWGRILGLASMKSLYMKKE